MTGMLDDIKQEENLIASSFVTNIHKSSTFWSAWHILLFCHFA
jgi:D-alanyl-lipoteichoic acid acyltransferase DltB (MBOAT superfamily)